MFVNGDYLHQHKIDIPWSSSANVLDSIKDLNNKIVGASSSVAALLGFSKPNDLIKTPLFDSELPCKASLLSKYFVNEDKGSVSGADSIKCLFMSYYAKNELKVILGEKASFFNKAGEVIGFLCRAFDLTKTSFINMHSVLNKLHPNQIIEGQFSLILTNDYPNLSLSNRQSECLYYLLRGFSYPDIAARLNISLRTVETYIEHIKNKMNCSNKQQIIEQAIVLGYLSIFPEGILNHG